MMNLRVTLDYIKTYVSYSFQIYTTVIYIVNYILATFYLKMEPCV